MPASKDRAGYFPVALRLEGRKCLVVGGGRVASRKVEALLSFGGKVTVVAPGSHPALEGLARAGRIALEAREYAPGEAASFGLVIAAAGSEEVNRRVFEDCRAAGVLVNVADDPGRCDFILSGLVRRGPLTVAVGTQGKAPFFARWIRRRLEELLPESLGWTAELAASFRKSLRSRRDLASGEREDLFRRFLETDWEEVFAREGRAGAEARVAALLGKGPTHDRPG